MIDRVLADVVDENEATFQTFMRLISPAQVKLLRAISAEGVVKGYVSPDYFCDREEETKRLISALLNGRNVTLISPRRMGKTGLIRHAFHHLNIGKQAKCYYVDLYKTDSLSSLVKQLANVVLGSLDATEDKIIKQVTTFFKSLRPLFSFDSLSGVPTFTVDVKPELAEYSLTEIPVNR